MRLSWIGIVGLAASLGGCNSRDTFSAFSAFKARLGDGCNHSILIIGDSTGTRLGPEGTTQRFVYRVAKYMADAADTPLIVHWYDRQSESFAETWGDASGASRSLTVYNASFGGARLFEWMGWRFNNLTAIHADMVIVNLGLNMADQPSQQNVEEFADALSKIKSQWLVPVVMHLQQPMRDNNLMAAVVSAQREAAAKIGGVTLVDSYSNVIRAGRPQSFYRDDVHLSFDLGDEFVANVWKKAWDAARPMATGAECKRGIT